MDESTHRGITRRQVLQAGGATFAGYAVGVEKALAQAITTDTTGITSRTEDEVKTSSEPRSSSSGYAPSATSCAETSRSAARVTPARMPRSSDGV